MTQGDNQVHWVRLPGVQRGGMSRQERWETWEALPGTTVRSSAGGPISGKRTGPSPGGSRKRAYGPNDAADNTTRRREGPRLPSSGMKEAGMA